jgi:hypothetical protein
VHGRCGAREERDSPLSYLRKVTGPSVWRNLKTEVLSVRTTKAGWKRTTTYRATETREWPLECGHFLRIDMRRKTEGRVQCLDCKYPEIHKEAGP